MSEDFSVVIMKKSFNLSEYCFKNGTDYYGETDV